MKFMPVIATALLVMLTGCTTILVATTDENGIQEDPGVRTAGTVVEDESIETKVAVNMKSMEPAFKDAHFNVVSHNGVVLLVGQVQSEALKARAGQIAAQASAQGPPKSCNTRCARSTPWSSSSAPRWRA